MHEPTLVFDESSGPIAVRIALVWAFDLPGCPRTTTPPAYLSELLARVRAAGESHLAPERKAAVRAMLRHGKYKPAGRAKPSSEYLLSAALENTFPLVNGPVDVNNAVSLEYGYPASIFDLDKSGSAFLVRRGRAGESYVFNPSGQSIDLEDLLVVCRRTADGGWEACGNPVKDAMATKVFEDARNVGALVYAPLSEPPHILLACAERFKSLLDSECRAPKTGMSVHSPR